MIPFDPDSSPSVKSDAPDLKNAILEHLHFTLAKDRYTASKLDLYHAVAHAVRDQLVGRWINTQQAYYNADAKRVYYLSLEFLMGQTLTNSLINLGILENCRKALHELNFELDSLAALESDAGLGNGGLGRLAACLLDSMATLNIPAYGYGIRYDYGIFTQKIENGFQIETPDHWLRYGNPWEICRSEHLYPIYFYGKLKEGDKWVETEEVMAMPYDVPVPGYQNNVVNSLRLWQAKSPKGFNLSYFNHGNYIRAVEDIATTENISKVLYPNDNVFEGKELRLKQEYFLVAATLQDILRRYNKGHTHLDQITDKVAIQLNDTHPALAIAEMMRLLIDREELQWDAAWEITTQIFNYTNHTLLPEALEKWPLPLLEKVLPRHLQIIQKINAHWMEKSGHLKALSIIEEGSPPVANMAHLSIVGSHKVNGVSKLHSELLTTHMFPEFYKLNPQQFTNKTNGITPRRWLKLSNPQLATLISEKIGNEWVTQLDELKKLIPFKDDATFKKRWSDIKHANKAHLAQTILTENDLVIDPHSLFDCHVKRLHEYKRQLLNALHAISLYLRIKASPNKNWTPRTILFSGKAAPGYFMAKRIIKLITAISDVVNKDPATNSLLKVVFLANYRVSLAEKIIPAADLSEQISTAGTEASGTGNMKFALNGALTIGTLDGANIEMKEEIGGENLFIFGHTAEEIETLRASNYNPKEIYEKDPHLKEVIDLISSGFFSPQEKDLFEPLVYNLLHDGDPFFVLADFHPFIECQKKVDALYQTPDLWIEKSILNVAGSGHFSSDRTVKEYAEEIWRL